MTVKSLKKFLENLDDSRKVVIGKTWNLVEGSAYEIEQDFDIHIVKNRIVLIPFGEQKEMIYDKSKQNETL
jgi:hypothetical protein